MKRINLAKAYREGGTKEREGIGEIKGIKGEIVVHCDIGWCIIWYTHVTMCKNIGKGGGYVDLAQ